MGLPLWMKRVPLFALLFVYIFIGSALVVSVALVVLSVLLWPVSKNAYRWVSTYLAYSVLGQFAWICHDWAGIRTRLFAEAKAFDRLGRENALVTLSHRGDLDWVIGYLVGAHFKFLHTTRTLPKSSVFYVPGFGQILWALECAFLTRSFAKDEISIKNISDVYKNYPFPIQVCIFCEGTRFTQAKYLEGVQYAKDRNLTVFKHHLVPRTKGFATLAHHLKTSGEFPAIYDIGFAYPGLKTTPTFTDLLLGKPFTVCVYARCIPMNEVPIDRKELASFCYDLYLHKDNAYDYFLKQGVYPCPEYTEEFPRRVLWGLRLSLLFWLTALVILPCVLLTLWLSWTQLLFLVCLGLLLTAVLTIALLIYAYQPVGSPTAPPKKTD